MCCVGHAQGRAWCGAYGVGERRRVVPAVCRVPGVWAAQRQCAVWVCCGGGGVPGGEGPNELCERKRGHHGTAGA